MINNKDCLDQSNEEEALTFRYLGYSQDYEHYIDMHDIIYPDGMRLRVIDFI